MISSLGPQPVHNGPPTHYRNVTLRPPWAPEHQDCVNYKAMGMTEQTRMERAKNPKEVGGSQLDYRFGTAFHQDYYESAILKKDVIVARSRFIDWKFMKAYKDHKIEEIIRECKRKNIYKILGFAKSWNSEVIAQFYATCYFTSRNDEKVVHWMTEGNWYGISYKQFASLLGFDHDDTNRVKIHISPYMEKKDMKFMYILGQKHHYGSVHGMLPFYVYLHRMFRKTLAPREGDQSNISFYGRDLLKYMNPSERDFCVVDYIWEEMKTISCSPQKSCGYAPYLMHIIEAVTNSTFEYDHKHEPFHMKNDVKGPSLDQLPNMQTNVEEENASEEPTAAAAPSMAARTASGRGLGCGQHDVHNPPSPLRKMFNFLCGSCMNANDIAHKERQRRKRDSRMI